MFKLDELLRSSSFFFLINALSATNFLSSINSDLLLEATECLLIPKRKSQIHTHRVVPRRPTSVNHVLYAIGGMSRREASKSGEKYDPKERKWKPIGKLALLLNIVVVASSFSFARKSVEKNTNQVKLASVTASVTREHAIQVAKPRVASSASVSHAVDCSLVLRSFLRS